MIDKTIFLPCPPRRAFELLTEHAGAWWPPDRRHTMDPNSTIRVEEGGRFYERASDGTEVELGRVRAFEAPERLVLDWYPGTGPALPTHVEITLHAEGDGTRVRLLHRAGAHSAEVYREKVAAYERSWDLVFDAWRGAAQAGARG